jgi:hypothetical protein
MGQKPFEVGEVLWTWTGRLWFIVDAISKFGDPKMKGSDTYWDADNCSRDPHAEIPPKPKKMVTKEAKQFKVTSYLDGVAELTFHVPYGGKNVHCTYEVPED